MSKATSAYALHGSTRFGVAREARKEAGRQAQMMGELVLRTPRSVSRPWTDRDPVAGLLDGSALGRSPALVVVGDLIAVECVFFGIKRAPSQRNLCREQASAEQQLIDR